MVVSGKVIVKVKVSARLLWSLCPFVFIFIFLIFAVVVVQIDWAD